jgi:orotidine-5'-phosphate decarboxylase
MSKRLIAAIDTPDLARARGLIEQVAPHCGLVKLGLEFFLHHGANGYRRAAEGVPVFLDLKLHDIPNTVAGGVRALLDLGPKLLTIHAQGGARMVAAAAEAAAVLGPERPKIVAVTVLTSLGEPDLAEMGVSGAVSDQVLRLARVALENGADGLVCSAHEIKALRAEFGPRPLLVVPGIRPKGAELGDQTRVMTPEEAVSAGADYIVVGRPITGAADPAQAAADIAASLT